MLQQNMTDSFYKYCGESCNKNKKIVILTKTDAQTPDPIHVKRRERFPSGHTSVVLGQIANTE